MLKWLEHNWTELNWTELNWWLYFKRVAHSKETDNPVALYSPKTRPAPRDLHALLFAISVWVL